MQSEDHKEEKDNDKKLELGDLIKQFESTTNIKLSSEQPAIARLDGHGFSKFTKGLIKPYDEIFGQLMIQTTTHLVQEYNAHVGYTQSDEITLVFMPNFNQEKNVYQEYCFGNRVMKMVSLMASNATNYFTNQIRKLIQNNTIKPENYSEQTYKQLSDFPQCYFDCRIFNVPSDIEVFKCLKWRAGKDCIKNSISNTANAHFNHKVLQGLNSQQKIQKLKDEKNIDWETFPLHFKYGTYIKKKEVQKKIDEINLDYKQKKQLESKEQQQQKQDFVLRTQICQFNFNINDFKFEQLGYLLKKQIELNFDEKLFLSFSLLDLN